MIKIEINEREHEHTFGWRNHGKGTGWAFIFNLDRAIYDPES